MMRITQAAIALLLFAMLAEATVIAQNTQEGSSIPCSVGCVETKYDRFEDRTSVMLLPILLARDSDSTAQEGFRMAIAYSSPGKNIQRPNKVFLFFTVTDRYSKQEEPRAFKGNRSVYLLIDEVSHPLGQVESLGRREDNFLDAVYPRWAYSLEMSFEVLEKIASAKNIEIRAGSVEFKFDDNFKAVFRRLIEITPKEIVAPKKEDALPAKPPTPKRTTRRRRG